MTRNNVWLDGLSLQAIDPAIFITDVQEHEPEQQVITAARAAGEGQHLLRQTRQCLSVTIRFAIREQHVARRSAVLQKVKAWCRQGGFLSISQRPGLRLCVSPGRLNTLSALRWTEELTLTFTAHHTPWWEEAFPTQITLPKSSLNLPGDASSAPMDLRWVCSFSGTVDLCVSTPLSAITFSGLSITKKQELLLTHREGVLVATLDGTDILPYRTPESSDDLLLVCGDTNAVAVTVNGETAAGCILSARGRWL